MGLGAPLTSDQAQTYAAKLQHLWIVTEQLRPVGRFMQSLGPLAPPCIALPYTAMREKVLDAASVILESIRSHGTEEQWRDFERTLATGPLFPDPKGEGGLVGAFRSLPELKVYWSTAPSKWWGMTTVPQASHGKLGGLEPVVPPTPSGSIQRVVFTRTAAQAALPAAEAAWGSRFFRVLGAGGRIFGRAFNGLTIAYLAWEGRNGIGDYLTTLIREKTPPADVSGVIDQVISTFNDIFVPEVVQQLRAAARAVKSAGANPAAILQALLAVTPSSEKPMPSLREALDLGADGDETVVGDSTKFHHDPWLPLGVLVAGTAADLALGME